LVVRAQALLTSWFIASRMTAVVVDTAAQSKRCFDLNAVSVALDPLVPFTVQVKNAATRVSALDVARNTTDISYFVNCFSFNPRFVLVLLRAVLIFLCFLLWSSMHFPPHRASWP
jgi:hypothetical protein